MTPLGYVALFSLPLVVLALFALLPPRKAVIYSFLWGFFFLPMKAISVHGLSEYSKVSGTPLVVLLGAVLFDTDRVLKLRLKWWDLPILTFLICPFFSSLHNDLGAYDGANAVLNQFYLWGGGYFVGRIYFTDLEGLNELAMGFVLGGLLYIPLCLYEVRMSPQLHIKLYGFAQHQFLQTKRFGGFRPIVFMQHGLALGVWMISTAMAGWWLWWCGAFKRMWHIEAGIWVAALLITVVLCRALEAAILMAIGMGVLIAVRKFLPLGKLAIVALILVPPAYVYVRANTLWTGQTMVQWAGKISPDRASSLAFRLKNEDLLVAKAKQSLLFGWAGWNRFQATDVNGKLSVPDQEWIIAYGHTGLIGLISIITALLLPAVLLMRRVPVRYWSHPSACGAAVLAVIVTLHLWDCLLNAMINPMFMIACGGLTGLLPVKIRFVQRAGISANSGTPAISRPVGTPAPALPPGESLPPGAAAELSPR